VTTDATRPGRACGSAGACSRCLPPGLAQACSPHMPRASRFEAQIETLQPVSRRRAARAALRGFACTRWLLVGARMRDVYRRKRGPSEPASQPTPRDQGRACGSAGACSRCLPPRLAQACSPHTPRASRFETQIETLQPVWRRRAARTALRGFACTRWLLVGARMRDVYRWKRGPSGPRKSLLGRRALAPGLIRAWRREPRGETCRRPVEIRSSTSAVLAGL